MQPHPRALPPASPSVPAPVPAEDLIFCTVDGATDLLLEELRSLAPLSDLHRTANQVSCRLATTLDALSVPMLYASVALQIGPATADRPDPAVLCRSADSGLLSRLPAPLRFRVGVTDHSRRASVIAALERQTGWVNDPGGWDINITRSLDHWVAEIGCLHHSRRVGRFRRQPWSTNPVLAAVLARIAKIGPEQHLHDPFCGTGTLLITARLAAPGIRLTGTDHDPVSVAMARDNLAAFGVDARLGRREAVPFEHPDHSLHRVLSNLPFGKQVGTHAGNRSLYPALLVEIARTLQPDGRAVLLTEDKRLLTASVATTPGIKISRERLLRYGGATPSAYTLTRTRGAGHRRARSR